MTDWKRSSITLAIQPCSTRPAEADGVEREGLFIAKLPDVQRWDIYHAGSGLYVAGAFPKQKNAIAAAEELFTMTDWTADAQTVSQHIQRHLIVQIEQRHRA